jgi:hypothetical protein
MGIKEDLAELADQFISLRDAVSSIAILSGEPEKKAAYWLHSKLMDDRRLIFIAKQGYSLKYVHDVVFDEAESEDYIFEDNWTRSRVYLQAILENVYRDGNQSNNSEENYFGFARKNFYDLLFNHGYDVGTEAYLKAKSWIPEDCPQWAQMQIEALQAKIKDLLIVESVPKIAPTAPHTSPLSADLAAVLDPTHADHAPDLAEAIRLWLALYGGEAPKHSHSAACGHWMKAQGISDSFIDSTAGKRIKEVTSPQRAWDAQRKERHANRKKQD